MEQPISSTNLHRKQKKAAKPKRRIPIISLADMNTNRMNILRELKLPSAERQKRMKPVGWDTPVNSDYDWLHNPRSIWDKLEPGMWKNRPCYVVGGGPSLKNFDWSQLDGELSIGINRAYEKYDPSIMFCMDPRVWGWIARGDFGPASTKKYEEFTGLKVWAQSTNFIFPDNIHTVSLTELEPHGSNSGHAAINIAIQLGANPIYLLGFDMKGDGSGRQVWFHDGYPELQNAKVYDGFLSALQADAPRIKDTGTRVINLTPRSALKCFPKSTIRKVVAERKPPVRPLVISFFTEGTSYEKEAQRLIGSLNKFDYEYDIIPKPNMGGWKKNTYYKAQFIRDMMDKHPDRNLLWLDADSAMIHYPILFDNADADIGVFIADWKKIGNVKARLNYKKFLTKTELISATIYLANNDRTRAVMDAWIAMNEKNYETVGLEQVNLHLVLKAWTNPLNVMQLPPAYSQVFDIMAHLGEPIIEQYQAARRLKGEVGK